MNSSEKRGISIEEKINIFKKFAQTGESLTGTTVYEGYPIGQWSVQIRSIIKNKKAKYSKEVVQELSDLGILEPMRESTIDEKIKVVSDLHQKFPSLKFGEKSSFPENLLKEYSEEEQKKLIEMHEKSKKYYRYILARKSRGKLNEEQLEQVEKIRTLPIPDEVKELSEKYRIKPEKIKYILDKYNNMQHFVNLYRNGNLDEEDKKILKHNLRSGMISVNEGENKNWDKLCDAIFGDSLLSHDSWRLYDIDKVKEVLDTITLRERKILEERFGLVDNRKKTLKEIGDNFGVNGNRIGQIEAKALRKLRRPYRSRRVIYDCKYSEIENKIFNSNIIFYSDEEYANRPIDIDKQELSDIFNKHQEELELLKRTSEKEKKEIKEIKDSDDIGKLELPIRIYNCIKRSGINTVGEFKKLKEEQLLEIRNMGKKSVEETLQKIEELKHSEKKKGVSKKEEATKKSSEISIEEKSPEETLQKLEELKHSEEEIKQDVPKEEESTKYNDDVSAEEKSAEIDDTKVETPKEENMKNQMEEEKPDDEYIELERVRNRKNEIEESIILLQEKIKVAEELLASYEKLIELKGLDKKAKE